MQTNRFIIFQDYLIVNIINRNFKDESARQKVITYIKFLLPRQCLGCITIEYLDDENWRERERIKKKEKKILAYKLVRRKNFRSSPKFNLRS